MDLHYSTQGEVINKDNILEDLRKGAKIHRKVRKFAQDILKPDTGGERNIHSPYLSVKYAIISSSDFSFFISSRIFPLMLVEKPASESLTDNP